MKSIKANFIMNALLTMSSFIFPLITFPYVSRVLLPIGTGKVSFATSLISYFNMIAQLGIPTYGIRVCAMVRDDREQLSRTAQELLIINICMSIVSYVALAFGLCFIPRLREDRVLYVITSSTIFLTAIGMEWLYKALEQYTYITIRSLCMKVIALVSMFLLVREQRDYVIYGVISVFASAFSNILNFYNVRKYIDVRPVGNYCLKRHLKPIGVFFAMACATTIYGNLDTVMLGFMKTDIDVGYYNAAVKIKNVLVSVVTSLGAVLLPRASYYVEKGLMRQFSEVTRKALNFVFIIAPALTVYFAIFAQSCVYLVSGMAYNNSILPMQIIMPTVFIIGISNITGIQMLVPLGKEKIVLYSEIVGAIVNVCINSLLIPQFASAGAAIGTVIAETVVLMVQLLSLKTTYSDAFKAVPYVKMGVGIIFAIVSSFWVRIVFIDDLLVLLLSAFLYWTVYIISLLIMKESMLIEVVKQLWGKLSSGVLKKNKKQ